MVKGKKAGKGQEVEPEKKVPKVSQKEYEGKVLELGKKGLTAESIGESLRKEGIHPKEYS
jgi:hypothetical protein